MTFILVIRPVRPSFPNDATDQERAIIGDHFEYLKAGFEAGKVAFVGRCQDAEFGIAVFQSESLDAAREFCEADPAISNGIFSYQVKEFMTVLS